MAAPKGNKNAVGNRGGGRSKAGDTSKLLALWNGDIRLEDIKYKMTAQGRTFQNGYDAFCYKVLTGDVSALKHLLDKIFPNPKPQNNFILNDQQANFKDKLKKLTSQELHEVRGLYAQAQTVMDSANERLKTVQDSITI